MGPKITVDSSTMANKGLEVIEAHWLFGRKPDEIQVVVHPQSIIHSLVEFIDGSILAQLSPPSMTFALQHTLLYPDRSEGVIDTLDFSQVMQFDFRPPDIGRFPCLRLAREALISGGTAPAAFNASNEEAVSAFLENRIEYLTIPIIIERTLETVSCFEPQNLDQVLEFEASARQVARGKITDYES
jgi:1-deoxy-D-xylulose-5-phosphate reductoisomerase